MVYTGQRCLVIGGAGNLGARIIEALLEKRMPVVCFDRTEFPAPGLDVVSIVGDLCDAEAMRHAMQGIDIVFHTAALVDLRPIVSPALQEVNVDGTRNVIECCKAAGVRSLVYTSSFYTVTGYGSDDKLRDIKDGDESMPGPKTHVLPYNRTKAEAEALVLEAHSDELRTCALRPGLIVGPGCISMKLEMGMAIGRFNHFLTARLPGDLMCTHVRNCAAAHVLASEKMDSPSVGGQAFFIGDFEANVTDMTLESFKDTVMQPVVLNAYVAYVFLILLNIFWVCLQKFASIFGSTVDLPTTVVDKKAFDLAWQNTCFSTKRANEALGYRGAITKEETIQEMRAWAKEHYTNLLNSAGKTKLA